MIGRPPVPAEQRFFRFVEQQGDCWIWTGTVVQTYGQFRVSETVRAKAHRWSYEFLRAQIPDGLQIDHLCRNRVCVNPWHLEPVTARVNTLRSSSHVAANAVKTQCAHGHPFTPANTIAVPGGRKCRECRRGNSRDYMRRRRVAERMESSK